MLDTSRGDRIFDFINTTMLVLITIIVLYPLLFVLSASVSDPSAVVRGELWLLPEGLNFEGYKKVFQNSEILTGYMNTIFYTVLGTAINLFMTICAAYPLSRKDFKGRHVVTAIIVFTMFFSGGLIPTYLLIKKLHMLNTFWALVIPNAVAVTNIIIMRTYFQSSIPYEIQEAASIDGCNNFQILLRVVMPLSMPIIAVMILFYAVGHWNAFFNALIYLTDRGKYPLQLILREIL
ncbi:carbohydrate ABC transporter permease, partial [Paenibacillus sp. J31TS4]|uniref:carbohydrate ABC transporter permease n=1 Tax=Paenibacillus sp. J31TS4 TaxID=2807195 RepID=UPI001BCB0128